MNATPMIEMIQAAIARGWQCQCGAPVLLCSELRALSPDDLGLLSDMFCDLGGIGDSVLLVADNMGLLLPPLTRKGYDDMCPGDRVCEAWPFGASFTCFERSPRARRSPSEFHISDDGYWSGEPVFC